MKDAHHRPDPPTRFRLANQQIRAIVYAVACAFGFLFLSIEDRPTEPALFILLFAELSALAVWSFYRLELHKRLGFGLDPAWLTADVIIVSYGIYVEGGWPSVFSPWYLVNIGSAAVSIGLVAAAVVALADAAGFITVLVLLGQIQGADRTLFLAIAMITNLYFASFFFLRAVRELQRKREQVKSLREEERRRVEELAEANLGLIEERQRAEEERRRAEEANRAKSVFLANMSHELRTPLNGILGFVQLMDRDKRLEAEQRQNLATILRCGDTLLGLINDVLSLSKIEAGRVSLKPAPFDLVRLLLGLEEMLRIRAEAQDLTLTHQIAPGIPRAVIGDEGHLRQILTNLLGNAIKFTDRGGVTLRAHWAEGRGVFEVEDTGPGIAHEELEQLFVPFVQTESGRRTKEGTGLGLAISRSFARLMDGDITVASELGRGTCFTVAIALPEASADAEVAERGAREVRRVIGLAPGQPASRILVADDLADNRVLLTKLLTAIGFEVREAVDGNDAVRIWREWQPHLIWMDKRMPRMDGIEATRIIREEERARGEDHVVIIALSASALDHERGDILAAGCDDFLPKPSREDAIFAKMAAHLGVVYVYESEETAVQGASSELSPARFAALPADWITALRNAITAGDTREAGAIADRIGEHDAPLAATLRQALREFRLDEIEAALATAGDR